MSALVWFRSDLRWDDNRALARACADHAGVAGVFLLSPAQWREHDWGGRKQLFVWRHVLRLRETLAERGIPLWVLMAPRFDEAVSAIANLARKLGARTVFCNAEYGVNELQRDRDVAVTLKAQHIAFRCADDLTLLPPGSVTTQDGKPFRVFTAFRNAVLARLRGTQPECRAAAAMGPPITPPPLPEWTPPEATIDAEWWPVGEDAAHKRLVHFLNSAVARYHEDRDRPAIDGTSRLSPYLATGALSIRRCVEGALQLNNGEWDRGDRGITTWLNELLWREFYLHVLVAFPRVSRNRPFRPETSRIAWRRSSADFERWRDGRTGYPLIDAAMRQLTQTGWMHNRGRMLTAMFLSKLLLLDWRLGERYFMQQLIDGDLAANNGGWQWSASTGTDAAPYFRILSPARQAARFDPDGTYTRRWLPELVAVSTAALLRPGAPALLTAGYPAPMVDPAFARQRALAAFGAL